MSLRYEVVQGGGVLARTGQAVVWVTPDVTADALRILRKLSSTSPGDDPTGADTHDRLHDVLEELAPHPPFTFAALLVDGDRAQGVLRGPVIVRNETGPAPVSAYGPVGVTVPFSMSEAVFVGYAGTSARPANPLLSLDDGVVLGDGTWVHPGPADSADDQTPESQAEDRATGAPSAPTQTPQQDDDPASGLDGGAEDPAAAPAVPMSPAAAAAAGAGAMGAAASAGPPGFVADALTGGAMPATGAGAASALAGAELARESGDLPVHESASPVASAPILPPPPPPPGQPGFAPAPDYLRVDLRTAVPPATLPPLPPMDPAAPAAQQPQNRRRGVLVFDDGSTFALDNDYVIGRKPERHALVQEGQARPLTVVDPDTVLSGAHAALRLRGDEAYLEDLGSLNGSHIAPPGATEWTRLESHTPVRLEPGTRLLFGWTVATYSE